MSPLVAPSGEFLRSEHLVWLIGAVVHLLSADRSSCTLARAMDGCISIAAPLALADQLPLPMIVKID